MTTNDTTNLKTTYLGIELAHPLIAGSCPMTGELERARQLVEAGAAAIVMRSIFEEQIREDVAGMYDALESQGSAAALDYLRADLPMQLGPERYVENLRAMRKGLSVPVIASINCIEPDQWVSFARKLERAGADAIELNVYDIPLDGGEDSAAIEARHLELVQRIKAEVKLPVGVKLSPYYSGLLNFARRLEQLNVGGLVLFNRFLQPDIDIESLRLQYTVHRSHPNDLRLPLRWLAILRSRIGCDLALSSGVHDASALVKALLVGANAVYVCSALYRKPEGSVIDAALKGLRAWMERHDFRDLSDFQGRMREQDLKDGKGFERAHYVKALGRVD